MASPLNLTNNKVLDLLSSIKNINKGSKESKKYRALSKTEEIDREINELQEDY